MDIDLTDAGRKDLEAIANDVASIGDFQERLNATNKVLEAYRNSRMIKEEYESHAEKLKSGEMSEAMAEIYAQITMERGGKGSDLDFTSTRTWVRKLADKVIAAFRAGVEGNVEGNYNLFTMYMKSADRMSRHEEGTMLNAVHSMVAQGNGEEARRARKRGGKGREKTKSSSCTRGTYTA